MRGEFIGVWPETWTALWEPLGAADTAPQELFGVREVLGDDECGGIVSHKGLPS